MLPFDRLDLLSPSLCASCCLGLSRLVEELIDLFHRVVRWGIHHSLHLPAPILIWNILTAGVGMIRSL